MVELVGVHRADQAHVVDDLAEVRQDVGDLDARFPAADEAEPRPEHGRIRTNEGVSLAADDRRRDRFAFELGQLGLVIEEIEMARRPGHEQVNHAPWPVPDSARFGRPSDSLAWLAAAAPARVSTPEKSPASAIRPRPTPHCSKNQRRVTS